MWYNGYEDVKRYTQRYGYKREPVYSLNKYELQPQYQWDPGRVLMDHEQRHFFIHSLNFTKLNEIAD